MQQKNRATLRSGFYPYLRKGLNYYHKFEKIFIYKYIIHYIIENMLTFAFTLRMWRSRRQFSQVALAHKSGVTQATLSRLESNQEKPRWETLQRLASSLRISSSELFLDRPQPEVKLNRYDVEAVARAVVSGERKLSAVLNRIADETASLMINKLQAHNVPGYRRVAGLRSLAPFRRTRVSFEISPKMRAHLLERSHRLLPLYCEKDNSI